MNEVDFTDDLWLFFSPWCKENKLEDIRYADPIAFAWVTLWNYTVDRTTMNLAQVHDACRDLMVIPTDELLDILYKRRIVFFPDDNRVIKRYRVAYQNEELFVFVEFDNQTS